MDINESSRLQQLDKEALIKQVLGLRQENQYLSNQLQKSEDQFRAFTENIQAAVYIFDENSMITYANPFLSLLSGYANDELLQMPIHELVHPDHKEMAIERIRARFAEGLPSKQHDVKLLDKSGNVQWVVLHSENLELQGHKVTLGTAIDITARKKIENDLRRSEEKFKTFAENAQVMIFTYDSKGCFTYVNKMCEVLTGYSRDELVGMNFTKLLHDDYKDLSVERAVSRRAFEANGLSYDYVGVKKDGTCRWWELSGVPLVGTDGEITILGCAVDITERVESERALKESEGKFRSLFERSSDPMLLLGEEGFFDCNQAAVELLKAKSKEEVTIHPARLSPVRQPDGRLSQKKAEEMIKRTYETGFHRFEWFHCDLEGREFWADISLTVIPFENR
ncbi:MAG: hypothetical protein DRH03_10845, partial [Deltaproteobacteria bacterium]